ncbi:MAG: choice-of-anchor D domain-containing protein [Sedimentisphaerales bacterium]|nr:choice-of-anchor D domain-containing protein [Sedimentisphaerales bacterium]
MLHLESLEPRRLLSVLVFPDGTDIDYGDVGVGRPSGEEVIVIINDGEETVNITELTLAGDSNFTLQSPAPGKELPYTGFFSADEVVPLSLGEVKVAEINSEEDNFNNFNLDVYYFEAEAGEQIVVTALLEHQGSLYTELFTNYGNLMDSADAYFGLGGSSIYGNPAVIEYPAYYSGGYYLVVESSSQDVYPGYYKLQVNANPQGTIPEIDFDTDAVGSKGTYTGILNVDPIAVDNYEWLLFEAAYGTEVEISLESSLDDDPNSEQQKDNLSAEVYNLYGEYLGSVDTDSKFPLSGTIYADGNYYVRVIYDENYDMYPPVDIEYHLAIENSGDLFELKSYTEMEPVNGNQQYTWKQIPVWLVPSAIKEYEGHAVLKTDFEGGTEHDFAFYGNGVPGDLQITNLEVTNLPEFPYVPEGEIVPDFVQSGKSTDVSVSIWNSGLGDIDQVPQIKFVVSEDHIFGNSDDIPLGSPMDLLPLYSFTQMNFEATLQIPAGLKGNYRIMAGVDSYNFIPENEDLLDPVPAYADTNNVAWTAKMIFSPDDALIVDSVKDYFDQSINYGNRLLGTVNTEYVWIYNRGDAAIVVSGYELAEGIQFKLPGPSDQNYQVMPVSIPSGESRAFPVIFVPTQYALDGNDFYSDMLSFHGNSGLDFSVELAGNVSGPDLRILENSGVAENDDQMDLGQIRIGQSSDPQSFTLVNLGDQYLYINHMDFGGGEFSAFSYVPDVKLPLTLAPAGNPGSSYDFEMIFSPYSTAGFLETLTIKSNENAGSYVINLEGQGIAPELVVHETLGDMDDNYLPFGWHPLGEVATTEITLSNYGSDALTIYGWSFNNAIADDFSVDIINDPTFSGDDVVLGANESIVLQVSFLAPGEGAYSDTLTIYSDDGEHTVNLSSLAGQSAKPSLQFIHEGSYIEQLDLGMEDIYMGQFDTELFYINNNGAVELNLSELELQGVGFSLIQPMVTEAIVLQPGENLPVVVRFDAAAERGTGDFFGTFVISGTAGDFSVPIEAEVVTPEISLNPHDVLDFGIINESETAEQLLEVSNLEGSAELVISEWLINDPQFSVEVPVDNLVGGQIVIPAGGVINLTVVYQPDEYGSVSEATILTLISNDYDEPISEVALAAQNLGQPVELASKTSYGFYDSDGDLVRITMTSGSALLYLNNGQFSGGDIEVLTLLDTNASTKVTVSVRGETSIEQIISGNSLGMLNAPGVTVHGIDITGSLSQMFLGDVAANSQINISESSKPMVIRAEDIYENVDFDLTGIKVKTFQAKSFGPNGSLLAKDINIANITNGNLDAALVAQSGSINRTIVRGDIGGDLLADKEIGSVLSKTGSISGSLVALNGSINQVNAREDISANVIALHDINVLSTRAGTFSATVRAEKINSIAAVNMDQAIVSAADYLGTVNIKADVRDSHVLAGYDIGMDGMPDNATDVLTMGDINQFRFGGEFSNTYVAAGVMTENIYTSLLLGSASGREYSSGKGAIGRVQGTNIDFDSGGASFGFYAAETIGTNLLAQGNFDVLGNL